MENLPTSSIFVTLQIILLYMFLGVCVMFILILEINLLLVVMSVLFVGYPYGKKGWGVLDLHTKEFCISQDVHFHESYFPFQTSPYFPTFPSQNTTPEPCNKHDQHSLDFYQLPSHFNVSNSSLGLSPCRPP